MRSPSDNRPDAEAPAASDDATPPPRVERWEWIALAAMVFVAALLRLYRVQERGIFIDEVDTYEFARRDFFWQALFRTHGIAFFIYRLPALFGGDGELTLRLPSVLFSILSVPMIYAGGRRFFRSRRVAFFSALFAALSLYQLMYAQEARYYPLNTFFSALSLYVMAGLLRRPTVPALIGFVLINFVNFGIHPSTAVFFAAQTAYLAAAAAMAGSPLERLKNLRRVSWKRPQPWLWSLGLVAVGALGWFGWRLFKIPFYLQRMSGRLSRFPDIELTPGVEFSLSFFRRFFYEFSVFYNGRFSWSVLSGEIYMVLFAVGLIYVFVRYRPQALFIVLTYLVSWAAIFLFKADIPFVVKYVIYLFPIHAWTISLGLVALSDGLLRLRRNPSTRVDRYLLGAVAILGLQAMQLHDYGIYLTSSKRPGRSVLEYIAERESGPIHLITSSHGFRTFQYYENSFEIGSLGVVEHNVEDIVHGLEQGKSLWAAPAWFSYSPGERRTYFGMLEALGFEKQSEFEAFGGIARNIPLFHNDASRFCLPGRIHRFKARVGGEPTGDGEFHLRETSDGPYVGEERLRLPEAAQYRLEIRANRVAANYIKAKVRRTGAFNELPLTSSGNRRISAPFKLPAGEFTLKLELSSAADSTGTLDLALIPVSGRIPGIFVDKHVGSLANGPQVRNGIVFYAALRNSNATYRVDAPKAGDFQFALQALNNPGAPAWVEVAVNDNPLGILAFDGMNMEIGERFFAAQLGEGENRVEFRFLNDGVFRSNVGHGANGDVDFIIAGLNFAPLDSAEQGKSDIWSETAFLRYEQRDIAYDFGKEDGALGDFWMAEGDMPYEAIDEGRGIRASPEKRDDSLLIFSRNFPVLPDRFLYCTLNIGLNELERHSIAVEAIFFDEEAEPIVEMHRFLSRGMGTAPAHALPCVWRVPSGAHRASIVLSVSPLGDQGSGELGEAVFRDFRFLPQ